MRILYILDVVHFGASVLFYIVSREWKKRTMRSGARNMKIPPKNCVQEEADEWEERQMESRHATKKQVFDASSIKRILYIGEERRCVTYTRSRFIHLGIHIEVLLAAYIQFSHDA